MGERALSSNQTDQSVTPDLPRDPEDPESLPVDVQLDTQGLTFLDRFFQTLDHPKFRAMPPGKQILYLQLLRWSHGRQSQLVEASRTHMSEWTGLSFDTIKKYIPSLIRDGLVVVARDPTPINPTAYEVKWLPPCPKGSAPNIQAIQCYLEQLDDKERAELKRLEGMLTHRERTQLYSEVTWELRDMGIQYDYALVQALIKWKYLVRSPYQHTLARNHPNWFNAPE